MALTPETISKIANWRAKVVAGTITQEELAEALRVMRGDRIGAAIASDKSRRSKAKAEIPDADELLREMGAA